MTAAIHVNDLPASENAHRFDGERYGAYVSVFISQNRPGHGPGLHTHPYEETFIVEEGKARFTVDDQELAVRGGEIIVVPAGVPHKFVNVGDTPLRKISIHPAPTMVTEWLE